MKNYIYLIAMLAVLLGITAVSVYSAHKIELRVNSIKQVLEEQFKTAEELANTNKGTE